MNRNSRFLAVLLTIATVGVLPVAAVAQGPDGYMPTGPGVVQDTEPPPGSDSPASDPEPSPPGDTAPSADSPPSRAGAPSPAAAPANAGGRAPAPQAVQAGALPFTGVDLGLMALAGLAVLALGAGLRRVATRPSAR